MNTSTATRRTTPLVEGPLTVTRQVGCVLVGLAGLDALAVPSRLRPQV